MLKQVWFHIHGKPPEQTAKIMAKVLKKIKFIKVVCVDGKCLIQTTAVPDSLNSWLIERLLHSKKFLGKYHTEHVSFSPKIFEKVDKIQIKMQTCISRFGFWDSVDFPDENSFGDFLIRKTQHMLNNVPLWKAIKMAIQESSYQITETENPLNYSHKADLIQNLVKYHKTSKKEAREIINREFPYLANIKKPKELEMTRKTIDTINNKTIELIETLKFYSPRNRRKYLDNNDNFDKFLIFSALFVKNGREWIIENIGEVENWT